VLIGQQRLSESPQKDRECLDGSRDPNDLVCGVTHVDFCSLQCARDLDMVTSAQRLSEPTRVMSAADVMVLDMLSASAERAARWDWFPHDRLVATDA
jgi:hypothetical protein